MMLVTLSNNYASYFGFMAGCTSVSILEHYKIALEHYQIVMAIRCKLMLFFNRKNSSTVLAFGLS